MAVDMFLKLEKVEGESIDKAHPNEIEVLSWGWGVNQSATFHGGTGGGGGKASIKNLSITKYMDKSSPTLFQLCATGEHIPTAQLTVRKAGKEPLEYYVLKLNKVLVASYTTGGNGGMDRITETISLNFSEVEIAYQPQDVTGAKKGGAVSVKWNIPANAAA